jgi:hypothetical protein
MPNYCQNTLCITGPTVPEVLKAICTADHKVFDFETIIRIPEPFAMKSAGINDLAILCATKPEDDLGDYAAYPWIARTSVKTQTDLCQMHGTTRQEMVKHGQQVLDNFDKYGGGGMPELCKRIWGTKWNAVDPVLLESSDGTKAEIGFATAWSPPLPVIKVLGRRFPDHNFTLRYEGENEAFQGVLEIKNGVVTKDTNRDAEY